MDLTEFESAFKKAASGDFTVKIDESRVSPEFLELASSANQMLDKFRKTAELKARADIMMKYNPLAVAIITKDHKRVFINKKYEKLWRGTHDELIRGSLSDYDVKIIGGEHYFATFDTKKPTMTKMLVTFKDGVKKSMTLYAIPLLDKKGMVESAFTIYTDDTDLVEQMNEVHQIRARVDRILQENPYPLFTINPDLSITMTNLAFQKMTGYSKDRLGNLSMKDFGYKKNKGDSVEMTIRSKRRSQGESVIEFPNGTYTLEWYYIPLVDNEGNVESVLVVYNDITENRRKELEVKKLMDEAKEHADALSKSADELETGLSLIAKGDLTFKAPVTEGDPLIRLKKDYNEAVTSVQNLVLDLGGAIQKMKVTTEDTSKSTQEISKSTEQVAIQTQRTSEGTKKQMDEIDSVSKEISDLSASIEEIASTSHTLMEHAGKAATEGNNAAELGRITTAKMAVVEKISGESVQEITALNERMKEISTIVRMIADISSQTNLLALNAAIEAARAGEHGRGFAVVAGEVRNLAGESKNATGQIEELISSIQENSNKTAAAINSSYTEIRAGIESVNKTVESLNRITTESNVVAQGVTEITKATEEQAEATTRVMQGMEQTKTIIRENQERMEDMAALAEETSASTEEIASASTELASMADHLETRMKVFKVR